MKLNDMISALEELKGWKSLPYCIEEPMDIEGLGVVTENLIENLIILIEFVKMLPSDLEQRYKTQVNPTTNNNYSKRMSNLVNRAINLRVDDSIAYIEHFIHVLENPEDNLQKETTS